MTIYQTAAGLVFELGDELPILDDNDKIIGNTQSGDIVLIINEEAEVDSLLAEAVIATGEFAGCRINLNEEDLKGSILVHWPRGERAYLREIPLTSC